MVANLIMLFADKYFYCSSDFPMLKIQSWARFLCSSGSSCLSFILRPPLVLSSSYSSKPSAWAFVALLILFVVSLLSLCCVLFFPCLFLHTLSFPLSQVFPQILSSVFYFSLSDSCRWLRRFPSPHTFFCCFPFHPPLSSEGTAPRSALWTASKRQQTPRPFDLLDNCCQLSCSTAADPHVAPLSSVFN